MRRKREREREREREEDFVYNNTTSIQAIVDTIIKVIDGMFYILAKK